MRIRKFIFLIVVFCLTNSGFSQTFVDSNTIKGIWRTNDDETLICVDSFLYLNDYCYNYYFNRDTLFLLDHYKEFNKNTYSEMYKTEFVDSFNFKIKRIGNITRKYDRLKSCRNIKAYIDTSIKFQGLFFAASPNYSNFAPFSFEIDSVGNYYFSTRKKLKRWKYKNFRSYSSGKLNDSNLKKLYEHFKTSLLDSMPSSGGMAIDAPSYHIDLKYNNRVKRFEGTDFPEYKYDFLNYMFELYEVMVKDSTFKVVDDSFKIEFNKFQLRSSLKSKIGYPELDIKILDLTRLVINKISRMYSTRLTPDVYSYTIVEDTLTLYKRPVVEIKSSPTSADSVVIKINGFSRDSKPFFYFSLNLESEYYKSKLNGELYLKFKKSNSPLSFYCTDFKSHEEKNILITPDANKEIFIEFIRWQLRTGQEFIFKKRNGENGFYLDNGYPLVLEE